MFYLFSSFLDVFLVFFDFSGFSSFFVSVSEKSFFLVDGKMLLTKIPMPRIEKAILKIFPTTGIKQTSHIIADVIIKIPSVPILFPTFNLFAIRFAIVITNIKEPNKQTSNSSIIPIVAIVEVILLLLVCLLGSLI